ncbi:MAG: EAL domain-containing protein [Xanthobacteraceae bacterium]
MKALRTIKLLLVVVIALFAIAASYISVLIVERQATLREVSRYNVAWLVSQATTEFARLEQRLSAFEYSRSVGPDEVQLRFDIVLNRLKLLESGDVEDFLAASPEHMQTVDALNVAIERSKPFIDDIEQPGAVSKVLALLAPLYPKLAALAAAANTYGGARVADDQQQLVRLHWLFTGLAYGLILCGVAFILLLLWHNRLLQRAHRELHTLTSDLQRTTRDLGTANQAVQDANAELHMQNYMLRARDKELRTQNERFDAALNNMSQALCMVDSDQRLIVCNERFVSLFDLDPSGVKPGTPILQLIESMPLAHRTPSNLAAVHARQEALIRQHAASSYFQELPDGRTVAISYQPMAEGGWLATYEDITERRRVEARIAHMAHHDALTDLPNRTLLRERMEQALAGARENGGSTAILCLDLDRFKGVNDTLGHPTGDALLKAVSERLRRCIGQDGVVARFGGDEFAILQVGGEQPKDARLLAERVLEIIGEPYGLDGQHVIAGTSIGIAVAPRDGTSPDQLLKNADMALYRAKSDGRGIYRFFESEMDAQVQARRFVELDLRRAVDAEEFELYYQPLIDLKSNQIVACEALLRWNHPERGLIGPGDFIPIAEEIGLILPIGEWVLRKACTEAYSWPKHVSVAINLSPVQFKSRNLVQAVILALANSGLSPQRLELEITESVLLEDNEMTLSLLHQLRNLGVSIALDDFGTGYSSLSYLRSFPLDKIKIDQSFIRDLAEHPDSLAIVQSITRLGTSLGMQTTAEGVETKEQLEQLRAAGCTHGQGYYFGRPQPARDIARLLGESRPRMTEAA